MNTTATILSIGTARFPSHVRLLWETDRVYNTARTFKVYRGISRSEQSELLGEVSSTPGSRISTFDEHTSALYNFYQEQFYRIDQYLGSTLEASSDPFNWNLGYQLHEIAILADQEILFHYDMGSPCYLHSINTSTNVRCPKCWDVSRGRVNTDDSCPVCYGTGRQDPYLSPYLIWPEFGVTSKENAIEEFGEIQPGQRMVQINGIPAVKPKDILHDPIRHVIWNVVKVEVFGRLGAPVLQKALIAKIDIDTCEYRYITRSPSQVSELATSLIAIQKERRF